MIDFAKVLLMLPNAVLMAPDNWLITAVAPKVMRATTKAYSTRSWPS